MEPQPHGMETLREAHERLEARGFRQAFRPRADGRLAYAREQPLDPASLEVVEVVRFEGESDPGDQAVLFALRSPDGRIRGTFSTRYGPGMDPDSVAVIERLTPRLRGPAAKGRS